MRINANDLSPRECIPAATDLPINVAELGGPGDLVAGDVARLSASCEPNRDVADLPPGTKTVRS